MVVRVESQHQALRQLLVVIHSQTHVWLLLGLLCLVPLNLSTFLNRLRASFSLSDKFASAHEGEADPVHHSQRHHLMIPTNPNLVVLFVPFFENTLWCHNVAD